MSDFEFATPDYSKLKASFPDIHADFSEHLNAPTDPSVRPINHALAVLEVIEYIAPRTQKLLEAHPHFLPLFEKEWGDYKNITDQDSICELCFLEQFLFPENQSCPIQEETSLASYKEQFDQWMAKTESDHEESQKQIQEHFSEHLSPLKLPCRCPKCTGDLRTFLREDLFNKAKEDILNSTENFKALPPESPRHDFVDIYYKLCKRIDRRINKAAPKLRRGSVHKLKTQLDSLIQSHFRYENELLGLYREKLDELIIQELQAKGLRKDLIDEGQKTRFFKQRGRGIWKGDQVLAREIQRLIQTVLSLKRKDISAKILQDYLGQFWIHTEARKLKRRVTYHMGPTNSGKTWNAIQNLSKVDKGCYLAPLRLLATELYDTLNEMGVKTTLLTGEEVIELKDASHTSSTIEMVKLHEPFDMCVIDEIQMINDPQRGWAWTRALVGVQAPDIHLCGDPTALELIQKICDLCGDHLEIKEYHRMTDLKILPHKVRADELQKHDAVIVFSRRNALRYKIDLEKLGYKVSIVYGRLSPEVRREQARKFDAGETDIIVSTDAISMGMNLPIKRVVFTTLSKFIDNKEIPISNSEIKQIAGRSGRYNRFPTGFISTLERVEDGLEKIQDAMAEELPQKDFAMVGPDLDIFSKVNQALKAASLPDLGLAEFLRLFNTMQFDYPFYCVDLKEMIEITEMVEQTNSRADSLDHAEVFGFACAPVNLGLPDHVQFFLSIVNRYVHQKSITCQKTDSNSENIDYLETSIKCIELYQWLARHFHNKHFEYDEHELLHNKTAAIEKLNALLSEKMTLSCMVCGCKLPPKHEHMICDSCFQKRRFRRRRPRKAFGTKPTAKTDGQRSERSGRMSKGKRSQNQNRRTRGKGGPKAKRSHPFSKR
ncbi:MAG: DEAD/DEAH box helicase [Bacteriovoracales bacterium]|nr:DEAD/DEAH box helicase [Bacteriovoracales bacterium]